MSKKLNLKREYTKWGKVFRIEDDGSITVDGKQDDGIEVTAHREGVNVYTVWYKGWLVGEIQKDFGSYSNTPPSWERIATWEEVLPNGNIRKWDRNIYRTKNGLQCKDNWGDWLSDGVRHAPEPRTGSKPAPFEMP